MNRSTALNILKLPKNATRDQIEESYNQLRAFYYPDFYGRPHEFTTQQMQERLYASLSRDRYKEPKGVQYKDFVDDTYHYALTEYALVCQAYEYLTDPANQNQYNVDPRSPYGHDVLRYGLAFANVRRVITWLVSWIAKPMLIAYLVSGLISVMDNGHHEIISVVANMFKYLYIAIMGSAAITMPMDVLLFIPDGLWAGIWGGAQMGPWIFRPITMLLTGALGAVVNAFVFIWKPRYMMEEREYSCDPPIKNEKKGRAAAAQWYQKTLENMDVLGKDGIMSVNDDMPCIRSALKDLAEKYKRARSSVAGAQACGEMDVRQAEKNFDRQDRVGWLYEGEMDEALDNIQKAREESYKAVSEANRAFSTADRRLYAFTHRAGADPDDYIN